MKNLKLIEILRRQELEKRCLETSGSRRDLREAASQIIRALLEEEFKPPSLCEASVHRPRRGRIWVAYFTGPNGGQVSKSTGQTDRDQALRLAQEWEAEAQAQRAKQSPLTKRRSHRLVHAGSSAGGGLSQREVAIIMNMSERSVREIERRALWKLRHHPLLQELWDEYLSAILEENSCELTPAEITALFDAARSAEEWRVLEKLLRMIGW